jgi:hypothetical protein
MRKCLKSCNSGCFCDGSCFIDIYPEPDTCIWKKSTPTTIKYDDPYPTSPGIYDDPFAPKLPCSHPQHDPPMNIVIPYGKILVHVCPGCGKRYVIRGSTVSF